MGSTRVILVDDHRLLRSGVRSLLEDLEDIEVVAEASDGLEALALIERHRPDVILSDITMPGLNGLELSERVAAAYPEARVIILSMHSDPEYVRKAILAGASGYLLKDSEETELGLAIRAVGRGEFYLSPRAAGHVVDNLVKRPPAVPDAASVLTPRQSEILVLIADGMTTKAIARKLGISDKTVEAHRTQLMDRLDIHDIAGLVRYAVRAGLLGPDP
jgi:DNA-binding NarL/FixJ family response regulator